MQPSLPVPKRTQAKAEHSVHLTRGQLSSLSRRSRPNAKGDLQQDLPLPERGATAQNTLKIATWNVNSLRARYDLFVEWLKTAAPDVVCLQETKVIDEDFPTLELQMLGYTVAMAGQRTYNGVAIASRLPMKDIEVGLVDDPLSSEKRLIAATVGDLRILSAYIPNGKSVESPSFGDKLRWLAALRRTLDERVPKGLPVVLAGDFNIAADERDVFDVERMRGHLHFHEKEHEALKHLLDFGLFDAFRLHHNEGKLFSWWDYRGASLRLNQGLRIDYVFLSHALKLRCVSAEMQREERLKAKPSDHIPVVVEVSSV